MQRKNKLAPNLRFFLDTPESIVLYYASIQHAPKWRNWQTQQTQNLPLATTCRFKSGLRHHLWNKPHVLWGFFVCSKIMVAKSMWLW